MDGRSAQSLWQDPDGWVQIRQFQNGREAQEHALTLIAMGINCRIDSSDWALGLSVAGHDEARARRELAQYAAENRPRVVQELPPRPAAEAVDSALVYAVVMVLVAYLADKFVFGFNWLTAGAANGALILAGEWWRAITALTLHADLGHLASNLASGAFIGIGLNRFLGGGLSWLSILAAGTLGNLVNIAVQGGGHNAIGASTAIFGGLGILSIFAWQHRKQVARGRAKLGPLVAGATLLGFMGSGGGDITIDVGAHIAGFAVGLGLGFLIHAADRWLPKSIPAQFGYGAAALAIVTGAWAMALA